MPTTLNCPSCSRPLRVPDELLGRQVKCPSCGTTFQAAATESAGAALAPSGPLAEGDRLEGGGDAAYDTGGYAPHERVMGARESAAEVVKGPAITLLVTGILNLLLGGYILINGLVMRAMGEEAVLDLLQKQGQLPGARPGAPPAQEERDFLKQVLTLGTGIYIGWGILSLVMAGIIIVAAIKMMKLRSRGLALTASILAMIPFTSPCCLLGLPVGIWSMLVLSKPEVSAAFEAAAHYAPPDVGERGF